jgi:hypothetical protein
MRKVFLTRGIILEGFCDVNIKRGGVQRVYNRAAMNEKYRPIKEHEKRIWRIRNEPKMYEYDCQPDIQGVLLAAVIYLLIRLQESDRSAIEWLETTNAPESEPPSQDSEA